MQQRERETCARQNRTAASLADIADQISTSKALVDAAFMAAQELTDDQRTPLSALLDLISKKLRTAGAEIQARASQEVAPDAA